MDYAFYKIIHLVGLAILAIGLGGMVAESSNRRTFVMLQGIALLILLVSGFGILAKLKLGFPHFAMVKAVLWLVIGMLPLIFRKLKIRICFAITISILLITIAAWLGVTKPALW